MAGLFSFLREATSFESSQDGLSPSYGTALDQPLSITRMQFGDTVTTAGHPWHWWPAFAVIPHWNWRGEADWGTLGGLGANNGGAYTCWAGETNRCIGPLWRPRLFSLAQQRPDTAVFQWYGTLLTGKEDGAGLQYHRNRYVDPATGRFTQEDPIGLAGGINVYGFAGGDPVTYGDPFGLCCTWQQAANLAAGFGDGLSFGITSIIRRVTPGGDGVDYNSDLYTAGLFASLAVDVLGAAAAKVAVPDGGAVEPPGPAGNSIPASGPRIRAGEQRQVNDLGNESGCHTCGATTPGTKSGNWVGDHQPPNAMAEPGEPQRLYPQCLKCSRIQGGQVRQATRVPKGEAAKPQ